MLNTQEERADRYRARRIAQERNLFGRLQTAALSSRKQAQQLLKSAGVLSITEWRVLWDLAEAGPLSVTQMATIQHADHAQISRAIPTMVSKGYVKTSTEEDDRRKSLITLTGTGRAVFEEASVTMTARRAALAKEFSEDEMDTFLQLIHRFEQFVQEPLTPTLVNRRK